MSAHRAAGPRHGRAVAAALVGLAAVAFPVLVVALDRPEERPAPPAPTSAAPCQSVPFTYGDGGRTWWSCTPNPQEAPSWPSSSPPS